jgi:hypothetical protein
MNNVIKVDDGKNMREQKFQWLSFVFVCLLALAGFVGNDDGRRVEGG